MVRFLLVTGFLAFPTSLWAQPGLDKKAGDLYVVAIGQEAGWKFLPEGFEKVVREQGKSLYHEIHSRVLTGPKATRKELLDGVDWMCQCAKAEDLVMLFIACHGTCTPAGESVFTTIDGKVRPKEIKQRLAKLPCQAIVVNDACCSGNWPKEFPDDRMPPNVTALCCCQWNQVSGVEFDITLFEALYGKADFNHDGIVDLDEVIKYCEMRIKEVQGGKLTPVLHKAKSLKTKLPLTKATDKLVAVAHQGTVYSAFIEKQIGDDYQVHVIGCNNKPGPFSITTKFSRDSIIFPSDGAAVLAMKDGLWHPACLLAKNDRGCKVRFTGSGKKDGMVHFEEIRPLFAGNSVAKSPLK
jgi:hypothetical protein